MSRYMTYNMFEVAMNSFAGVEPDEYQPMYSSQGKKMTVAIYNDRSKVIPKKNMKVIGINEAGEVFEAPLLYLGDGEKDFQSTVNHFKHKEFFPRVDEENENDKDLQDAPA